MGLDRISGRHRCEEKIRRRRIKKEIRLRLMDREKEALNE